jgi:protein arginine kinase
MKSAAESVLDAAHRGGGPLSRAKSLSADNLTEEVFENLESRRYTTRDWSEPGSCKFVLIPPSGDFSLLINEEDHIRLQAILPGLQPEAAANLANEAEERLSRSLQFARNDRIGFLTASISNAGTGARLSVLLHLPGLARTQMLEATLEASLQTGCTVRGLFGEGSAGTGAFFQVSNGCGYGLEFRQIVDRVGASARYLVDAERIARQSLFGDESGRSRLREELEAAVRLLFTSDVPPRDLLRHVSLFRLGSAMGLIEGDLTAASEWVYLAGSCANSETNSPAERFQSIRGSAALRRRLRSDLSASGTL